jgi:hypothetical protein
VLVVVSQHQAGREQGRERCRREVVLVAQADAVAIADLQRSGVKLTQTFRVDALRRCRQPLLVEDAAQFRDGCIELPCELRQSLVRFDEGVVFHEEPQRAVLGAADRSWRHALAELGVETGADEVSVEDCG